MVRNGQRFTPPDDRCQTCKCQKGSVTCEPVRCPETKCSNPIKVPGECCPVCPSVCVLEGIEHPEGQTFKRPGEDCQTCICQDGTVVCKAVECELSSCSHPATRPSECCPNCDFCLFDGRTFRNQQRFVHPQDMCQQCVCEFGTVTCNQTACPELTCAQPMPMAGSCCPVCPKQCKFHGLSYDDGETFVNPRDKCEDCICRQAYVQCKMRMCPQVDCANPAIGDCCPVCTGCVYASLLLRDGETVPDPNDRCQTCQCLSGSVRCLSVTCPPVTCSNPIQDGCCPVCMGCEFRGRDYDNGDVITTADRCQTCVCQDGSVQCQNNPCPLAQCSHPSRDYCCPECRNCAYQGRKYRDGEIVRASDRNSCQECRCSKGNVSCKRKQCSAVTCTHPVQGQCCPVCRDCQVDGTVVRSSAYIQSQEDQCLECRCTMGSLICQPKQCPSTRDCRHPVQRECCQECSDCLYNGQEYRNGQLFSDPASDCVTCRCTYGTVRCRQQSCREAACSNPTQGKCCMECDGCDYNGRTYDNTQRFPDPSNPCKNCACQNGNIRCDVIDCSAVTTCSHPVTHPGECCPVCGQDCLYNNRIVRNGDRLEQNCQICTCAGGNVRCLDVTCPQATCSHPASDGCCQDCSRCYIDGVNYEDGETFKDNENPCNKCTCRAGSVTCEKETCPAVTCKHPEMGRCCRTCRGCEYDGGSLINGQLFNDKNNPCLQCECEWGTVTCHRHPCRNSLSSLPCRDPAPDVCGCPTCDACTYNGRTVPNGGLVPDSEDPCKECDCQDGTISCRRRSCVQTCLHPVSMSGCCPRCDDCLYEGSVRLEGKSFVPVEEPCQTCTCQQGSVVCETMECPQLPCTDPITLPGECCPSCRKRCVYQGKTYKDNQRVINPDNTCVSCTCKNGNVECSTKECKAATCLHPREDICGCPSCDQCLFEGVAYSNGVTFQPDDCRSCSCRNGNVVCSEQTCPQQLRCVSKRKVEGQCCEVCQGCTFRGILYDEGALWVMPDDPCVSCTCNGGMVTCMETDCYAPCDDPIELPGQCCPVCPTCHFEGRHYSDGDEFTPNEDPCDTCQCQDGHLRCLHNICPGMADCPEESVIRPQPGTCCPTCVSEFVSGCTKKDLGKTKKPRSEDPCFVCECKEDFMWVCAREECPSLTCPPDVQMYNAGECCPSCPACFDVSDATYHQEGSHWSAVEDPCLICSCNNGNILCSNQECEPIRCEASEIAVVPEGQCCQMCQPMPDTSCFYKGKEHESGEEWALDECTTCRCGGGQVFCNVRQCPLLRCDQDEAPVTTPGQCCPVCKKEPGTCMVFGDPHYRTFDGTTLHFQGTCRYIMSRDCENDLFSVEVQHDSRGARGDVAWAQNLTVTVAGATIDLLQDGAVKVNGQSVQTPYLYEPHILVEGSGKSLLLTTEIGLRVLWDGSHYGEITVPGSFKRKLCGLCGNFNSFPQDDLRTRSGQFTNSPATFGNSWKASTQLREGCADADDFDPCLAVSYRARKLANSKCAILKGAPFTQCHHVVSPEPYFSSCVYDLCVCMDTPDCLCDIVATYAHECARSGVKVQWRSQDLCAFSCNASKGLVFDECGPVCPRTCETVQAERVLQRARAANATMPSGENGANQSVMGHTCFKPCVASCQCTADKVLHAGECISPEQCPHLETVNVV